MGFVVRGHLMKEIDALGGLIGFVSDISGIHFKVLNKSKGPAVQGLRGQMDRELYRTNMLKTLRAIPNLELHEAR